jgi:hypothetical protein
MHAAKFLYRNESKARPDEGEKACEALSQAMLLPMSSAIMPSSTFICAMSA